MTHTHETETVDMVRTGDRWALFGEAPSAWIQADVEAFVEVTN